MCEKSEIARSEAARIGVVIENDRDIDLFVSLLDKVGAAAIETATKKIKSQGLRRLYAGNIALALGLQPARVGDSVGNADPDAAADPVHVPVRAEATRADVEKAVEKVRQEAKDERDRRSARDIREREGRLLEDEKLRADFRACIDATLGPILERIERKR